ncbi:Zinc finger CCCH domain-containing protein 19 [Bienertia sinuspersici]
MEEEDDIKQSVELHPPSAEQPLMAPLQVEEESQVAEQCAKESPSMEEVNGENVGGLRLEDAKEEDDSGVKAEELETKKEGVVVERENEEVVEERENEEENIQELESEDAEVGIDGAKMEELETKDGELVEEKAKIENIGEESREVVVKEREEEEDEDNVVEEEKGGEEVEKVEEMVGEEGSGEEAAKEEEDRGEEAVKEEEDGGEEAGKLEGVVAEEVVKVEEVAGEELGGEEDEKLEAGGAAAVKVEEVTGEEEGSEAAVKAEEIAGEEIGGEEDEKEEEDEGSEEAEKGEEEEGSEAAVKMEEVAGEEIGEEDEKEEEDEGGEEVEKEEEGEEEEMEDSEAIGDEDENVGPAGDEEVSPVAGEDKEVVKEEETPNADTEMETELEVTKSSSGGKRRRGRSSKSITPVKAPARKTVGEDVCFICLDGGNLVLCDRRGCPKAYHPSCGHAAFDDKSSWEYLFKDYWIEQKEKLCITSEELAQAKNPWRNSNVSDRRQTQDGLHEGDIDAGTDSDNSHANLEVTESKRKRAKKKPKPVDSGTDSSLDKEAGTANRKSKRRLKSQAKETYSDSGHSSDNQDTSNKKGKRVRRLSKSRSKGGNSGAAAGAISAEGNIEWASQELLEFVMHMKSGDRSVLTQFDVQRLLLEYIKINKLRDPRRQSQIICDSMLQKLFGKARVGHFEMLKLLESHFLLKEDPHADDNQGSVVDTDISPDDHTDSFLDSGKSRGRKSRKRAEDREQSNLGDYAAIDRHNINLIYLRRGLIESLMDDPEMFHDKVVGSFVRIRISASSQKQDIYRLVQIIGTRKAPEAYKVGKRTTEVMLEILNLDKTEIVSIDTISNQEFTEDECKRLRQSIKCGLISRMTVGDVLEKAKELQEVRWLEAEIVRLSHLRDRASDLGQCVEKLQLLKTPEERQRRLNETPDVHADPKMDPSCESDDESEMHDKRQAKNMRPRESGFFRRGRDQFSSRKGGSLLNDSWSGNARPPNKSLELGRNLSNKGFSSRREDTAIASQTSDRTWNNGVEKGRLGQIVGRSQGIRSDSSAVAAAEPTQPLSTPVRQADGKVNETEKTWHYRDPTGKVQGPFSMAQLRKWSNTGYFPVDLRIWKTSQIEDDSILLTEALAGRFQKESRSVGSNSDVGSRIRNVPSSMDTSKLSGGRYESSNLPSPTPARSPATWSGKQQTNQFRGNERLPSPTPTSPSSDPSNVNRSNFSHQLKGNVAGNKQENVAASVGTIQPAPVQFVSNPGMVNAQQMSSQSALHVANQPFVPPETAMNQTNVGPNASGSGQGFSNMVQPGTGQNPPVYTHNWGAGYAARPEMVNPNLTPNNQNAMQSAQVAYNQWSNPVNNQASPYAAGYLLGKEILLLTSQLCL